MLGVQYILSLKFCNSHRFVNMYAFIERKMPLEITFLGFRDVKICTGINESCNLVLVCISPCMLSVCLVCLSVCLPTYLRIYLFVLHLTKIYSSSSLPSPSPPRFNSLSLHFFSEKGRFPTDANQPCHIKLQ